MTKILYATAAVAALTLASTPALAVPATQNATATARIIKPLTLTSRRNLDLGSITLIDSGSTTVGIDRLGNFSCPAGNVTCSGAPQTAEYRITGTNNQSVTVTVADVLLENQANTAITLMLDVDAPASVNLGNSGQAGTDFQIGGSITVNGTTVEGTYEGDFEVFVNY